MMLLLKRILKTFAMMGCKKGEYSILTTINMGIQRYYQRLLA